MAIDSDIRDQAYQFFIQEAPELLQLIEEELLTLRTERSTAKIHNMMRAAHSIKGGAASVGLDTIKTLAHSLEDIFKGLHNPELDINAEVEGLLLEAYDCLRLPLIEQIENGQCNNEQAMATAEPVFARIESSIGNFLKGAAELPSSVDLGVDIALSIFEVDVAQGIERLSAVITDPTGKEIAGELRAQAEVFAGIAELLNLPGFGAIASTAIAAIDAHPEQALQIAQLALADFEAGRQAVMAGDRTSGGNLSPALAALVEAAAPAVFNMPVDDVFGALAEVDLASMPLPAIPDSTVEDIFGALDAIGDLTAVPTAQTSLENVFGTLVETDVPATPIATPATTPETTALPNLDDIFGSIGQDSAIADASPSAAPQADSASIPSLDDIFGDLKLAEEPATPAVVAASEQKATDRSAQENPSDAIQSVEQIFGNLPPLEDLALPTGRSASIVPTTPKVSTVAEKTTAIAPSNPAPLKISGVARQAPETSKAGNKAATPQLSQLSVRVDLERLERMNNLVGELAINRNSLALQNDQMQAIIVALLRRFAKFRQIAHNLRDFADQMLVAPQSYRGLSSSAVGKSNSGNITAIAPTGLASFGQTSFDSLEMDNYGELHSLVQTTLEEIMQLEETVGDVVLLAGQSSQTLERQRQMLSHLRDDLMWARMLPLSEVLNRFPRMLRDLSNSYNKPVELKLNGTGVLVDRAVLEKLNDPLVHLVRNAFDHGIEMPEDRQQRGKPEQGTIEIRAYHQGSQTMIEVRDDGRGVNLDRIRAKGIDMGLLTPEQAAVAEPSRLLELLFEPGFSTASQVSQLSGRGVGLDVVRDQLRSLKGSVTLNSEPGRGTAFTLRIPLTLSIAKLLVCFVGSTALALPSDSIAEILIPQPDQVRVSSGKRFLHWQGHIVPAYHLSQLLQYSCPLPETQQNQSLATVPTPDDWAAPILLLEQDDQLIAIEVDRLVTEQELVIKPFSPAIAPPIYIYGCTILGNGCLIPVVDVSGLLQSFFGDGRRVGDVSALPSLPVAELPDDSTSTPSAPPVKTVTPTVLVVDDSITVRQTLALTLQKADYRVLQARDGREAINQLQQNLHIIQLVISDVEMPNMNGFEFLSHRRQDPQLSKIPVVMLTSRSSEKHQQLAKHLGAKHYFTKPYIEQEFLAAVKELLAEAVTP
ncbi:hybrid sensor histidine kinase/response regulator [Chroococcidiopsis sp. CCALA 051]|uniref:hybrid sensor histidine kinase/response regulator n=1 Tax=Chroococcidiopsis sp. CCALA 051 TaxID=869949 RepID=UPI000D0D1E92|nr:hybrid sensor histidine kinase/response regulator [Chroococcidiopsis sp. CCALA 051]PSM45807.1 hybrid sensor histidine kinase/response regulator [Chroococcidiopsis sp. CCALA 051]